MRRSIIAFLALSAAFTVLRAEVMFNGFVRSYGGWLTESGEQAVLQNTMSLDLSGGSSDMAWRVIPRLDQYNGGDSLALNLQQLYIDLFGSFWDMRIGHQQIIWGKADGVFITDIISPKDLSEFLLRDFDEIRSGVTAARLSLYRGNSRLESVWIPRFEPTVFPAAGSLWAPVKPFPVEPLFDRSGEDVKPSLENSEAFIRYAVMGSFMDVELMAGYAWDDDPTYGIQSLTMTAEGPELTLESSHERLIMTGASFNKPVGGWVLRGEGAYYSGKNFLKTLDMTAVQTALAQGLPLPEITLEKDYLHYLLGLDMNFFGIDVSSQFIQQYIVDFDPALQNEEYENMMTLMIRETFLRETLALELFSYMGLDDGDALVRPKISWDLGGGMKADLGANLFFGDSGMFGQYDENDMIYTRLRLDF